MIPTCAEEINTDEWTECSFGDFGTLCVHLITHSILNEA